MSSIKMTGQRKYYLENMDISKKRSLMCGLKKGRKAKPQTLDNNNVCLNDFTQEEYALLDPSVLAHLVLKDFKKQQDQQQHMTPIGS